MNLFKFCAFCNLAIICILTATIFLDNNSYQWLFVMLAAMSGQFCCLVAENEKEKNKNETNKKKGSVVKN